MPTTTTDEQAMQRVVRSINTFSVDVVFDKFPIDVKQKIKVYFNNKGGTISRKAIETFLLGCNYFRCNHCSMAFSDPKRLAKHLKKRKHYVSNAEFQARCKEMSEYSDAVASINAENMSNLALDICTRVKFEHVQLMLQSKAVLHTREAIQEQQGETPQ